MIRQSKKCRKGHSYEVDLSRTDSKFSKNNVIFIRKWTCKFCGKHLDKI
jgi:hypothetical protein